MIWVDSATLSITDPPRHIIRHARRIDISGLLHEVVRNHARAYGVHIDVVVEAVLQVEILLLAAHIDAMTRDCPPLTSLPLIGRRVARRRRRLPVGHAIEGIGAVP